MRLGRFVVIHEYYENPDIMIRLQRNMAVLNVRLDMMKYNSYEFMAVGEMFDDIPAGQIVPEYKVIYDIDADTITFTRT